MQLYIFIYVIQKIIRNFTKLLVIYNTKRICYPLYQTPLRELDVRSLMFESQKNVLKGVPSN